MPHIENLLEGYRQFYQKYYIENPETYKNLTEKGQTPHTLVIACSDSRVDPSIILNTGPGDIFVIRNVATWFRLMTAIFPTATEPPPPLNTPSST